jgi:hypothetical protein
MATYRYAQCQGCFKLIIYISVADNDALLAGASMEVPLACLLALYSG